MLILPIKRKWYDMILSGEKLEEYRSLTKYYGDRIGALGVGDGLEHYILLRNGYGRLRPTIMCKVTIGVGYGNPAWGAEDGVSYFVLRILDVTDVTKGADPDGE